MSILTLRCAREDCIINPNRLMNSKHEGHFGEILEVLNKSRYFTQADKGIMYLMLATHIEDNRLFQDVERELSQYLLGNHQLQDIEVHPQAEDDKQEFLIEARYTLWRTTLKYYHRSCIQGHENSKLIKMDLSTDLHNRNRYVNNRPVLKRILNAFLNETRGNSNWLAQERMAREKLFIECLLMLEGGSVARGVTLDKKDPAPVLPAPLKSNAHLHIGTHFTDNKYVSIRAIGNRLFALDTNHNVYVWRVTNTQSVVALGAVERKFYYATQFNPLNFLLNLNYLNNANLVLNRANPIFYNKSIPINNFILESTCGDYLVSIKKTGVASKKISCYFTSPINFLASEDNLSLINKKKASEIYRTVQSVDIKIIELSGYNIIYILITLSPGSYAPYLWVFMHKKGDGERLYFIDECTLPLKALNWSINHAKFFPIKLNNKIIFASVHNSNDIYFWAIEHATSDEASFENTAVKFNSFLKYPVRGSTHINNIDFSTDGKVMVVSSAEGLSLIEIQVNLNKFVFLPIGSYRTTKPVLRSALIEKNNYYLIVALGGTGILSTVTVRFLTENEGSINLSTAFPLEQQYIIPKRIAEYEKIVLICKSNPLMLNTLENLLIFLNKMKISVMMRYYLFYLELCQIFASLLWMMIVMKH